MRKNKIRTTKTKNSEKEPIAAAMGSFFVCQGAPMKIDFENVKNLKGNILPYQQNN